MHQHSIAACRVHTGAGAKWRDVSSPAWVVPPKGRARDSRGLPASSATSQGRGCKSSTPQPVRESAWCNNQGQLCQGTLHVLCPLMQTATPGSHDLYSLPRLTSRASTMQDFAHSSPSCSISASCTWRLSWSKPAQVGQGRDASTRSSGGTSGGNPYSGVKIAPQWVGNNGLRLHCLNNTNRSSPTLEGGAFTCKQHHQGAQLPTASLDCCRNAALEEHGVQQAPRAGAQKPSTGTCSRMLQSDLRYYRTRRMRAFGFARVDRS